MSNLHQSTIFVARIESSPLGPLWVAVTHKGLFSVEFDISEAGFTHKLRQRVPQATIRQDPEITFSACQQILEYLQAKRQIFDLEIDLSGIPPFQQQVLKMTLSIPFGQTVTYAQIAAAIGHPRAARAVGRAEATNPIPLVIPCHRVIGSDGKLHGYGGPGGIIMKAQLLALEQS